MADEVTEERDNTFRKDNLHDIQASNAEYLYRHLRIGEILDRLDRLEDKNGLDHPEPEVVVEGQPAWQREAYLSENQVLPIFPGPDNSTPVYVEDEADFRERIASVENKPVGLKPEERGDADEQPTSFDTDEPRTKDDGEADPAIKNPATVEEDEPEDGEQLSLFDEQGNIREQPE